MRMLILTALAFFSIPITILADEKIPVVDTRAKPDWRLKIGVSKDQSSWNFEEPSMVVTPTFIADKMYIPFDLSDAWRELDKMLPAGYRRDVVSKYGEDCSSEKISDPYYFFNSFFIAFLSEKWLEQKSSRLADFFAVLFHVDRNVMDKSDSKSLAISMILCGYGEKESLGEYPKISRLTSIFKNELMRTDRKRK